MGKQSINYGVALQEEATASLGTEVDPNDPIMKAMMAEMAAPNTGTPPTVIAAVGTPPYRPPEVNQPLMAPSQQAPPANSALADVFGDDEDEQPQRQLVNDSASYQ